MPNPTSLDAIDWTRLVAPGSAVVCSQMTAEPNALMRSLAAANPHDGDFSVFLGVPFAKTAASFAPATRLTTFGAIGGAGALAAKRPVRMLSTAYGAIGRLFSEGRERADVLLVGLARDSQGRLVLGASHGYVLDAARRCETVVAEVNAQAPAVRGAPWPDDLPIDVLVEVDEPLSVAPSVAATPVELAIAAHVAERVPDGACLQLGIGGMPSAVVAALHTHRGLGIHSGMYTPGLHRLVDRGAVDNTRKAIDPGASVTGCIYGDAALYRAVRDLSSLALRGPTHTHAADVIARLDRFTAINGAIEVDLLGQVNAETVRLDDGRLRYVGGVGGLNDFIRASRHARGGQAIVALPSRQALKPDAEGRVRFVPRIVPLLSGPATVAASDADLVVTEEGVADLRETSIDERARRLIAIAHPDDRDALRAAARGLGLIR